MLNSRAHQCSVHVLQTDFKRHCVCVCVCVCVWQWVRSRATRCWCPSTACSTTFTTRVSVRPTRTGTARHCSHAARATSSCRTSPSSSRAASTNSTASSSSAVQETKVTSLQRRSHIRCDARCCAAHVWTALYYGPQIRSKCTVIERFLRCGSKTGPILYFQWPQLMLVHINDFGTENLQRVSNFTYENCVFW